MAEYIPPTENLPTFDTLMFRSANDGITIAEGDARYLRFPVSQGSETISGNLTITGEGLCSTVPTTNNSLANKLYVDNAVIGGSILGTNNTWTGTNNFTNTTTAGTLNAGASTLASATITGALGADTATITNALGAGSISTAGTLNAGASTLTSVITDTQTGSAVGTAVSLYDEASRTGTVSIATGTGTRFINIGGGASSTSIFGSTCDLGSGSTTAAVNIANNGFFAGTVNIAAVGTGTKTINIGTTTGTTLNLIGTAINATLMSITNAVSAASASITGLMSAGSISTAGTLSAGASTLTSVITNELDGTAVGTAVSIYDEGTRSGAITLGTGATGKIITIGESSASTVNLRGNTIDANKLNVSGTLTAGTFAPTSLTTDTIQGTAVGTAVSLYDEVARTGAISIGASGTSAKTITIGNITATTLALVGSAISASLMSITGAVSAASASITGLMSAGSISTAGTLSAGASTLTSVITDTQTGSAVGTAVSLYNEATRTGRIDLGIGADARDIYIGNNTVIGSSTTRVRGCGVKIEANQEPLQITGNGLLEMISVGPMTIQAGNTENISIGNNMTNTAAFQLGGTAGGSATYTIASGNSQTGTISIGTGTGTKSMNLGGTGTTLGLVGSSVNVGNTATTGSITIGDALTSGTVVIASGASAAGNVNICTNSTASGLIAIGNNSGVGNTCQIVAGKNTALNINNSTGDVNLSTTRTNAGTLTICTDATSTRTINIGRGNAISIANSATPQTTLTGTVSINTGGTATTQLGNNSAAPVNILGTVAINAPSSTQSTSIGNTTGTLTLTGATVSIVGNFLIQQSTYPPSSTSALGYTGTVSVASTTLSSSIAQEATWNLPSKGCWLICATITFSTNSAADTEFYQAVISLTTASTTEASAGLSYYEEDNQVVSAANTRDRITLSGVVRVNALTALFYNAAGATSGTAPSSSAEITYTRIG